MRLKEPAERQVSSSSQEVSIRETLVRTALLVGLTLALASLFRFWSPAIRLAQKVAGTSGWQELYVLFHIESGLGREQLILTGIMIFCFLVALGLQALGMMALRRLRTRRD